MDGADGDSGAGVTEHTGGMVVSVLKLVVDFIQSVCSSAAAVLRWRGWFEQQTTRRRLGTSGAAGEPLVNQR